MQPRMTLDIDRKTASKLLNVSVRTIDRYIRSGKLPAREVNGRIWLSKRSIEKIKSPRLVAIDRKIPASTAAVKRISVSTQATRTAKAPDASFYKDLYDEARSTVTAYHTKLEQAHYKIGQLESQVSASQANKTNEPHDDLLTMQLARKELYEREHEITLLKESLKKETTNRIIFAVLTYGLLILQPIFWYLLR